MRNLKTQSSSLCSCFLNSGQKQLQWAKTITRAKVDVEGSLVPHSVLLMPPSTPTGSVDEYGVHRLNKPFS